MSRNDALSGRVARPELEKLVRRVGIALRIIFSAVCLAAAGAMFCLAIGRRQTDWTIADWSLVTCLLCGLVMIAVPGPRASRLRRRLLLLGCASVFGFLLIESYVRVFDPFPIVLRGGRISLPTNSERQFTADIAGLDKEITVRFNSLGFRGPEPPANWDDRFTIVCVGGSTTQCIYLSEGTTWPDRLAQQLALEHPNVWLNNAGLDGHSTFGHLQLLEQYLADLHPKLILFYIGLNDVDRNDLNESDSSSLRTEVQAEDSPARLLQRFLLRCSDTVALIDGLRLQALARRKGLTHGEPIAHRQLSGKLADESTAGATKARADWLSTRDPNCLTGFEDRVRKLVLRCKELQIECVLITQPVLYGEGIDDVTGIDLERIQVGETDGASHWQLLQRYNQVTAKVANELNVSLLDLANRMPKSSRYFYDLTHYNRDGAEKAASLIHQELQPHLTKFSNKQPTSD